jgi:hypothetical protein
MFGLSAAEIGEQDLAFLEDLESRRLIVRA